jgi:YVTN family beta-propeller protein
MQPTRRILLAALSLVLPASASSLLVLNKFENTLAILDPVDYHVIARVPTGDAPHEVAASTDGRLAFASNYGTGPAPGNSLSVIDLSSQKEIRRVDLGALQRPHGLFYSHGKLYFTVEGSRAIGRYDPAANKVDWLIGTGLIGTHMIVVTPDGNRTYNVNIGSDSVTSTDVATGKMEVIPVGKSPEGISLSPDGKELWVGQNGDGGISIIDTATNKVTKVLQVTQVPIRVRFTPDGKRVLISDPKTGDLIIYDAAARREVKRIPLGGTPVGILVTPDSKRAFVAQNGIGKVAVIDLASMNVIKTLDTGKGPDGLAWAGN